MSNARAIISVKYRNYRILLLLLFTTIISSLFNIVLNWQFWTGSLTLWYSGFYFYCFFFFHRMSRCTKNPSEIIKTTTFVIIITRTPRVRNAVYYYNALLPRYIMNSWSITAVIIIIAHGGVVINNTILLLLYLSS